MLYHECKSGNIVVRYEPDYDDSPETLEEFLVLLYYRCTDSINVSSYPVVCGNSYGYHELAAINNHADGAVGVYRIDDKDFRRFMEGRYVVLHRVGTITIEQAMSIEFEEGYDYSDVA